jgi:hypothetical protein
LPSPKLVAALCWYHEPADFLERLVRSLAGVVDELVAMDGPWDHFPHRGFASPDDQLATLELTAADVGLPLVMLGGERLFESQVRKRSELYAFVAERGDAMFIVDGDEEIVHHDGLREGLACDFLVGSVPIKRISPGRRDLDRSARRIFTTRYGLSVTETHNGIVTDDGRWLAGPRRIRKEPTLDCSQHVRILHRQMSRGEMRNAWSQRYYSTRARLRIEVH